MIAIRGTLGLILGVVFATALIAWRRRESAMPSSGRHPGANATLAIDAPPVADEPHRDDDPRHASRRFRRNLYPAVRRCADGRGSQG